MATHRFRTAFYKLLPAWLIDEEGELVHGSLGTLKDEFVDRLVQGLYARYPEFAPPDALAYLGRDRKIVRGINEPAESYAVRLMRWLDDHRTRGNAFALMDQLAAYCQADVRIRTVDSSGNWYTRERDGSRSWLLDQGNWNWDNASSAQWARFWVIIYPTAAGEPWAPMSPNIGDPGPWEDNIGTPGYTVGTTATPEQVASVRAIIREWKPAGTTCEWIIIAFDDGSFDPSVEDQPSPNPGLWGNWGYVDPSGNYVPSRLSTARYWKGPTS